MPRALKNLDISLGLATIPVQLFTATSFHLLHARCGSRIQMRLECPVHGIVPREETVKGYETAKDEYVRFEPEELKALEQASSAPRGAQGAPLAVSLGRTGLHALGHHRWAAGHLGRAGAGDRRGSDGLGGMRRSGRVDEWTRSGAIARLQALATRLGFPLTLGDAADLA